MPRVLLIPLGNSELPSWAFRSFDVERAKDEAQGTRWLKCQPCEAAIMVMRAGGAGLGELAHALDEACGLDVVPLVLAADASDPRTAQALREVSLDAFIDLTWDQELIERCLSVAIRRVRAGRGVAALQHEVLRAVRDEVAELKDLSVRDGTTGLFNSRHFRDVLAREHQRSQRHGRSYALACFDLDGLREINNTHGHGVGTRALMRLAAALSTTTRQSDQAFRIGGDEFVTLLTEANRQAAATYAERICATLRQCVLVEGAARIRVSVSAGVAVYPYDGDTSEAVLRSADAFLYRAKALGRDQVVTCRDASAGGSSR